MTRRSTDREWRACGFDLWKLWATWFASGREQELVLFYAVAVFVRFLAGLTAMVCVSLREHRPLLAVITRVAVAFLGDQRRFPPDARFSVAATAIIAVSPYVL